MSQATAEADSRNFDWAPVAFLTTSACGLAALGGLYTLHRMELAEPAAQILPPDLVAGNVWFTLATSPWIYFWLFAIAPGLVSGLGGYFLPKVLGVKQRAWPALYAASYWIFLSAATLFGVGLLSSSEATVILALHLAAASSVFATLALLATFIIVRGPELVPGAAGLAPWLIFFLSVAAALLALVVASEGTLQLVDRNSTAAFFDPWLRDDPRHMQDVFWLSGHPEARLAIVLSIYGALAGVWMISRADSLSRRLVLTACILLAFAALFVADRVHPTPWLAVGTLPYIAAIALAHATFAIWMNTAGPPRLFFLAAITFAALATSSDVWLSRTDVSLPLIFFYVDRTWLFVTGAQVMATLGGLLLLVGWATGREAPPGLSLFAFAAVFTGLLIRQSMKFLVILGGDYQFQNFMGMRWKTLEMLAVSLLVVGFVAFFAVIMICFFRGVERYRRTI